MPTSLYGLARSICQERGRAEGSGEQRHGWAYGFCEACLDEAMSRWDSLARLVWESHERARRAEHELASVVRYAREQTPPGARGPEVEAPLTAVMRALVARGPL